MATTTFRPYGKKKNTLWVVRESRTTNKKYWYNTKTKVSTWEDPKKRTPTRVPFSRPLIAYTEPLYTAQYTWLLQKDWNLHDGVLTHKDTNQTYFFDRHVPYCGYYLNKSNDRIFVHLESGKSQKEPNEVELVYERM